MQDRGDGAADRSHELAFRQLFADQFADLWRYARRRVATDLDADDVVAEVFGVAWRRRTELPPDPDVRPWLFGVARNVVANRRRSDRRRARLHVRLVDASATRPTTAPPADGSAGAGALGRALAALGDADRELLLMRAWDGLAVTEIAELLGCTPNAASVRLHKARRRLADALDVERTAERTDAVEDRTCPDRSPRTRGGTR